MSKNDLSSLVVRVELLEAEVFGGKARQPKTKKTHAKAATSKLNFGINVRAFVKRFVADKSGTKKFVLLLAYLTKGETEKNVSLADIRKEWDKMSAKNLLGKFNRFYPNNAKTQGWVDSKEYGTYCLSAGWQESYE